MVKIDVELEEVEGLKLLLVQTLGVDVEVDYKGSPTQAYLFRGKCYIDKYLEDFGYGV